MTDRLRVVHCLDSFDPGGTELNAVRTIERLDHATLDLRFVCLSRRGSLVARVEQAGVRIDEFAIRSLLSAGALATGARLARWLRRERIDIVHAHDIYSNIFVVPCARLAGVPVVIASRRWWTETNRPAHVWLNRIAYGLADAVLANSDAVGQLVLDEGVPTERLLVIPNFVDDEAFIPPAGSFLDAARSELGLKPGDIVAGIVANLHSIKDHASLLRAVSLLTGRYPRLKLVLVGEGAERDALGKLAQSLGLQERVVFAGRRPHTPSLHWLFDISVLSSRGEGFPNSIVEAMAAGRPIVATRVGGVPDAVTDGVSGLLVAPGSPEELAGALARILEDGALGARLAAAARDSARQRFAAGAVIPRLEAAYGSLIERARRGRRSR